MKKLVEFVIGDWCNDGHGRYESFVIEVDTDSENVTFELSKAEDKIINDFGIDISSWFTEDEDNKIPQKDMEKLVKLGIKINEPVVYSPDVYIEIWMQLVNKTGILTVKRFDIPVYGSKCHCYGLY